MERHSAFPRHPPNRGPSWLICGPRNLSAAVRRVRATTSTPRAAASTMVAGGGDESVGELGRLPRRDCPADHVAAEHVEDHVEVKAHPLGRPLELGDIPGPQLARAAGEQLGLGVGGWVTSLRRPWVTPRCAAAGGRWTPRRGNDPHRAAWRTRCGGSSPRKPVHAATRGSCVVPVRSVPGGGRARARGWRADTGCCAR